MRMSKESIRMMPFYPLPRWNIHNSRQKKAESVVYEIRVENGGLSDDTVSSVRLLNPYGKIKIVFGLVDGIWQEIGYKEYGQYIQVQMAGASAAYCIVSGDREGLWMWYAAGGAAVLLLAGSVVIRRHGKRKGKKAETAA